MCCGVSCRVWWGKELADTKRSDTMAHPIWKMPHDCMRVLGPWVLDSKQGKIKMQMDLEKSAMTRPAPLIEEGFRGGQKLYLKINQLLRTRFHANVQKNCVVPQLEQE